MERRILGEHFNKQGKPKRGFVSKRRAEEWARDHQVTLEAYLCTFCNKWHLATPREEET